MAEPIMWAHLARRTQAGPIGERGRPTIERLPQTATVGGYDENARTAPIRWRPVVDSEGNSLRVVITTAAADVDVDGQYARGQRAKWRRYGWYELGRCPCVLFLDGDLIAEHFADPGVLADAKNRQACEQGTYDHKRPCKHALAEMGARKARNVEDNAERMKNFKSDSEKMIEAQAANNRELLQGLLGQLVTAQAAKDKK